MNQTWFKYDGMIGSVNTPQSLHFNSNSINKKTHKKPVLSSYITGLHAPVLPFQKNEINKFPTLVKSCSIIHVSEDYSALSKNRKIRMASWQTRKRERLRNGSQAYWGLLSSVRPLSGTLSGATECPAWGHVAALGSYKQLRQTSPVFN